MNQGKVRIYELSRELNLDNKDILAICEQLNIAVKSHSSTIAEDEAERIRAYSDKYVASHEVAVASGLGKDKAPKSASVESPGDGAKKKLEIRKYQARTSPFESADSTIPDQSDSDWESDATVLQSPLNQQAISSMNQTYSRPLHPDQNQPLAEPTLPEEAAAADSVEDSPVAINPTMEQPPELAATPDPAPEPNPQSAAVKAPKAPRNLVEHQPKLKSPPVRPAEPTEPEKADSPLSARPILKGQKTEVSSAPSANNGGTVRATTAEKPSKQKVRSGAAASESTDTAVIAPPSRSIPELQRPRRSPAGDRDPARRTLDGTAAESADGVLDPLADESTTLGVDELQRPVHPKSTKKLKKQKDKSDKDDELELAEKSAKGLAKSKRRLKPFQEEDEDDLEGGLDGLLNNSQVSLSIARPPKPKPSPTTPIPGKGGGLSSAPGPTQGKGKKPGQSGDGGLGGRESRRQRREQAEKKPRPEQLAMSEAMTVRELAERLGIAETEIVKTLFFKGIAVNITQTLDLETATMVAGEFGVEVHSAETESEAKKVREFLDEADLENLQLRPPVVTIMGHVDHGKTTLLDAIRNTKVAQGEAGGITQHIGAYHVDVLHKGETSQVVFLDTPGHEAFTAMRARGARVTDIAILVVAADDGVQPQTKEAVSHAKAAGVPIVVAINKVDKESAQPDRVKQELAELGLLAEEWGGDTIMVPVSAIKGQNLDTLLEMILLVAELEELSANPDRSAVGTVIEAHLDKAKGPVASLLVQNGTLQVGDILVAGSAMGKVRAMTDDRGQRVDLATPSFAVEVLGLGDVPAAGDEFEVFDNEKEARAVADARAELQRESRLQQTMGSRRVSLNSLSAQAQEGQLKELNLILKADVQGSVEAILQALKQLPQNEVQVRILLAAPGEVTETDVDLAAASKAVIVGFSTTLASGARQAADRVGVDVRDYDIIYNLLDDIRGAMEGLLEPEMVEEALGQAQVRAVFQIGKGAVAGCYVQNGKMLRNCKVRILRDGHLIHEGILDSLKRMKEDAREVNSGYECGIGLDNFHAWQEGDIIEAFRMASKRRTLSS
ncbi:MAG TPA: translation initiation factor IF-2 [Oscillatoriaceae cyanobacterium M33_DOE_052]|uniref:Translation initiation factor IF-2 n=1 Tax=Planktothricoides sp. SpSt-374 TaxID=2282167 RepID=A0A7C3VFS6_9CYAN|nr:translation initiation factor IF-2 [Oscillatoriaceae cyanobacterium M33_DOE_052]